MGEIESNLGGVSQHLEPNLGELLGRKIGEFYSIKFVGDSDTNLFFLEGGGLLGEKHWGVLQHEICGRFRNKFIFFWRGGGTSERRKLGEFYSQNFVGHSEPKF